jgi:CheY-like chemotaxis protein
MSTGSGRILVVDDYRDSADMLVAMLRLEGYEVAAAYGGVEAIEVARAFQPELVILDISMPEVDGYRTAAMLRQERQEGSRLFLVAHTALAGRDVSQRCRQAGFDEQLAKPVDPEKLIALVESISGPPRRSAKYR